MKNILLPLIALGILASCNSKPEGYTINGTLIGDVADSTAVYLKKAGKQNGLVDVDTTMVVNGNFVFTGQKNSPEMHFIFVDQLGGYAAAIVENGEIEFTAHKDSLGFAKAIGTPQNEFLYDFQKNSREVSNQAMNIQKDLRTATGARDTVLINSLQEELNELRGEYESFELDYIKSHPNALISALLIDRAINTRTSTEEELRELYDGLTPEIKETEAAKKVLKTLDALNKKEASSKNTSVGAVAPDFSAPSPSGEFLALSDVKGKVTLIDFWAAWCRPCRAENPNVVKVYNKYKGKGLSIIGVSLDKTAEAWKKAISDDGLEWHHVSNIAYFDDAIAKLYNVDAIPATFLLDENGVIVAKNLRGPALEARISELLD
ncbi:AhpC/TSA family protein [Maribacter polysiphoniae]|uniref:AhpC/TSA family protein n=1 Tax=Maribacter polysiphoniae TaxID=429344 RepID=A0A316E1K7_9FLAO|nr:TlpA disulfide reductase family protein [Maribacter polysiphoniae]MBD1261336.1 AhpC/TSA family protein [Maribacter polysiphoniae]PWK23422.1 peroxiredoxin [Maribacter polysiphoniae]